MFFAKKQLLVFTGKVAVFFLTIYFLYLAVVADGNTLENWLPALWNTWKKEGRGVILVAALLIPVNWGLESWKWWLLARKLEPVSFLRAYRSVLVGLTLGFITPNRIGDYAGRIIELKSRKRLDAIGAIFLGRFCQMAVTILCGSGGTVYILTRFYLEDYPVTAFGVSLLFLAVSGVILFIMFNSKMIVNALASVKFLRRYVHFIQIMATYSKAEIGKVLGISALRYLVFVLQFILLLRAFDINLSGIEYAIGISATFLLKSLLPSLSALTDIGMRELSAMHFFSLFGQDKSLVLSASLSLWLLNIAVPSLIGLLFVLRLKVIRKR